MGASPDGILAYGFNLGGSDGGWEVEEVGEYGEFEPDWLVDGDVIGSMEAKLLAAIGFKETDWRADGYHKRKSEAKARIGVELEAHSFGEYPEYILATHRITAYEGDAKVVDFAALEAQRVAEDWDSKLRSAIAALGITPKQAQPAWLLSSYYG